MTREDITIGEFSSFVDGIEAAPITGAVVDRCVGMLGTRPPFRDYQEASQLSSEDLAFAMVIAVIASGVRSLSTEVVCIDNSVHMVAISKSGALALKGSEEYELNDVVSTIEELEGNYLYISYPNPIHVNIVLR